MSIEVEVLNEFYAIMKQYIPAKDRQEAADNVMSIMVDMLADDELRDFGCSDPALTKSLKQYTADADDEYIDDDFED